jgi:hypothetical protein
MRWHETTARPRWAAVQHLTALQLRAVLSVEVPDNDPMGTALSGCSRTPAERQRPWDAERSRFTKEVTGLNPVSPTVGTRHLGRNSVGSTFSSPLRV